MPGIVPVLIYRRDPVSMSSTAIPAAGSPNNQHFTEVIECAGAEIRPVEETDERHLEGVGVEIDTQVIHIWPTLFTPIGSDVSAHDVIVESTGERWVVLNINKEQRKARWRCTCKEYMAKIPAIGNYPAVP